MTELSEVDGNILEGLALADSIPGVRAARDIPLRRIRPSMTLLEFGP